MSDLEASGGRGCQGLTATAQGQCRRCPAQVEKEKKFDPATAETVKKFLAEVEKVEGRKEGRFQARPGHDQGRREDAVHRGL